MKKGEMSPEGVSVRSGEGIEEKASLCQVFTDRRDRLVPRARQLVIRVHRSL